MGYDGVGYDASVGDEGKDGTMTGSNEGALLHSITFDFSLWLSLDDSLCDVLDGQSFCMAVWRTFVVLASSAFLDGSSECGLPKEVDDSRSVQFNALLMMLWVTYRIVWYRLTMKYK